MRLPKRTRDDLVRESQLGHAVHALMPYMCADGSPVDDAHFIHSIHVIGSFTSQTECNALSDIDLIVLVPLTLFKDARALGRIRKILNQVESEVRRQDRGDVTPLETFVISTGWVESPLRRQDRGNRSLHIWPKPLEWYTNLRTSSLWYFGHQGKSGDYYRSCTPADLLSLDGWGGLASDVLLRYERATAVVLAGRDVFADMQLPETFDRSQWWQLAIVATRDLAAGFAERAEGWEALHQGDRLGETIVHRGECRIAKAVLRALYAEEILEDGQPLDSYTEIRDWALNRYGSDGRMTELVENAFDCKVLLKRTLLCSTAGLSLLALAKPEMTSVAPIANLFSTISNLKRHTIYFPEGFIHGELEPGVLEFYWERTLPGILKLLAHNDIDPRILSTYEPECRDYLTRELAELWRRGVAEEKLFPVSFHEAVAILERCIWFYLSYNPKLCGSAYEFLQMTGPRGKERVARIRAIANEVLYGPDSLHVQSDLPEWLRERIVEAIWTVAGILADYGTQGLMTLARIIHTHSCAILRIGIS